MKKIVLLMVMVGMAAFLTGFGGKDGGQEYLGKWQGGRDITLEISHNQGESLLVKKTAPDLFSGEVKTQKLPAIYKDNVLQVSDVNGMYFIMYDKESKTLVDYYGEYSKAE